LDQREIIFIHCDRWIHSVGDSLWFRAYCLNETTHKPIRKSRTIFVDLINDRDSVLFNQLLSISQQKLESCIFLPPILPGGKYWLRAYTRNILAEDSSRIYLHPLYLINPANTVPMESPSGLLQMKKDMEMPLVKFYPEGGAALEESNTNFAFSIHDHAGHPLDAEGYVSDSRDSINTTFKTLLPGLGKFNLYTRTGAIYRVHIKKEGGEDWIFPLNIGNPRGIKISVVDQTKDLFQIAVSSEPDLFRNHAFYLLAVSGGRLCAEGIVTDNTDWRITKSSLPHGRISLLLFNERQELVSERDVYNELHRLPELVKPDRSNYASRQKVKLSISNQDTSLMRQFSLMSVSVIDNRYSFNEPDALNFLTGEDWIIFQKGIDATAEALDLFMMTNPSQYSTVLNSAGNTVQFSAANQDGERLGKISGRVLNDKDEPEIHRIITIFSNQNTVILARDTTDQRGNFEFEIPDYYGQFQFALQVSDLKGRALDEKIILDTMEYPHFSTPVVLKRKYEELSSALASRVRTENFLDSASYVGKQWLKEVTVKGYKKPQQNYDVNKRLSMFSKLLTADQMHNGGVGTVTNALLMVPGVHQMGNHLVIGGQSGIGGFSEPLLVIDGTPIDLSGDVWSAGIYQSNLMNYLESIPTNTIDFIEVLTGPEAAVYGFRGGNGVISVNTLSKMRDDNQDKNGFKSFTLTGYAASSGFVGRDYGDKEQNKSSAPDHRPTLYWDGSAFLEGNKSTLLTFYKADDTADYLVTICGISSDGSILYKKINISRK
jgi:hypothetical protein